MASFILPRTGAIFGRPSARMAHWLYKTNLAEPEDKEENSEAKTEDRAVIKLVDRHRFRTEKDKKATLVELRIGGYKGAQTVAASSRAPRCSTHRRSTESRRPSSLATAPI